MCFGLVHVVWTCEMIFSNVCKYLFLHKADGEPAIDISGVIRAGYKAWLVQITASILIQSGRFGFDILAIFLET